MLYCVYADCIHFYNEHNISYMNIFIINILKYNDGNSFIKDRHVGHMCTIHLHLLQRNVTDD